MSRKPNDAASSLEKIKGAGLSLLRDVFEECRFIRIIPLMPGHFRYEFELAFLSERSDDLAMVKILGA